MPFRPPQSVLQSRGALPLKLVTLTPFLYPRTFNPRLLEQLSTPPRHSTPRCLRRQFSSGLIRRDAAASEPVPEKAEVVKTKADERVEEMVPVSEDIPEAISEEIFDPDPNFISVAQPTHPHATFTDAPFADIRTLSLVAGDGGHGCISFLREKFVANGPPNGGDGGAGGNIYIQAVYGETSLHKLGREGVVKATSGKNGKGSSLNGKRGENVVIQVPVGTVVREISRWDPTAEEERQEKEMMEFQKAREREAQDSEEEAITQRMRDHGHNEKWLHYPQALAQNLSSSYFNETPYPSHHHRSSSQLLQHTHPTRVFLDLSKPTPEPILLVPGAPGGLGNPHFITSKLRAPKFATRGNKGARMKIELELKILADVGLVGLPNAGKSSFLRAVSGRKARVGEWAFTTLSPNIGTIVMDESRLPPPTKDHKRGSSRPVHPRFTIADIPGLIRDAHMNKGLGHGFLRHVERARVLGFVVDLSRPDPVEDIKGLWREVIAYEEGWTGVSTDSTSASAGMLSEMSGNTNTADIEPIAEEDLASLNPELQKVILKQIPKETPHEKEEEEMVFYPGALSKIPHSEDPLVPGKKQAQKPKAAKNDPLKRAGERQKMSQKPWFVIANKADLPGTEDKYWALKAYVDAEGKKRKSKDDSEEAVGLIPISALKGEGVDRAVDWMKGMLGFSV
ncbi:GTPase of the mitochondrial inner membrane that associates with the large ribosomal subunit [Rhizina undulata]